MIILVNIEITCTFVNNLSIRAATVSSTCTAIGFVNLNENNNKSVN